ncbi:MAG: hypothetical protein ACM3RX_09685 [Methanococcaceae archaeon]
MKKIWILTGIILFSCFSAKSQALVVKDFGSVLMTDDGCYPSVENMKVVTPGGNILYRHVFQIPQEDSLIPEKGVKKEECNAFLCINGSQVELIDQEALFFSDGKVIVIFHSNGAGDATPVSKSGKK